MNTDAPSVLSALDRGVVSRDSFSLAARLAICREVTKAVLLAGDVGTDNNTADPMT